MNCCPKCKNGIGIPTSYHSWVCQGCHTEIGMSDDEVVDWKKNRTQMEIFNRLKPYFAECLITPKNGGCVHVGTYEVEQSSIKHPHEPKQVFRTMVWRHVGKLPGTPKSLTPDKLSRFIEAAKQKPHGVFNLN